MAARRIVAGVIALWLALGAAQAQDVQNFEPAAGGWNYFSVEGGGTAPGGSFVPALVLNYGYQPLVRRDADGEVIDAIVRHMATADAMLTYGVVDVIEITLDVPFGVTGAGDDPRNLASEGATLGDVRLIPKVNLYGGLDGPLAVAFAVPVSLPTGDEASFQAAGTTTINPKVAVEVRVADFRAAANAGFRARLDSAQIENVTVGNEVTYGAGVGYDVHRDVRLLGEVFGAVGVEDFADDSASRPLEALLGGRWFAPFGGVFTLGAGWGVVADYGSPDVRAVLGFAWWRRDRDRDGDGLLDDVDQCPDDPEDADGFQDADGCPDPDNDQDGVLDGADGCPLDPEDRDDFEDANGCPDPDNDQDGILDGADRCPLEPEDADGFEDDDGCPDPDNDHDGVLDADDRCPLEPEDVDGFEDTDGCPDPDNDKDGILDGDDRCPLEPETINGVDDEDGCPDEGVAKVQITRERIEILDRVYFDLGKATIREVSHDVLGQVASTLKANPQITKLRVEGHTDKFAGPRINVPLSRARAQAVRDYLIGRGIAAERLMAEGYGSTRPLVPHEEAGSPEKNRRVEFVIVEVNGEVVEKEAPPVPPLPEAGAAGERSIVVAGEGVTLLRVAHADSRARGTLGAGTRLPVLARGLFWKVRVQSGPLVGAEGFVRAQDLQGPE
jgi:outer membrane protein OmpA-like peptidoglycan-associated protein